MIVSPQPVDVRVALPSLPSILCCLPLPLPIHSMSHLSLHRDTKRTSSSSPLSYFWLLPSLTLVLYFLYLSLFIAIPTLPILTYFGYLLFHSYYPLPKPTPSPAWHLGSFESLTRMLSIYKMEEQCVLVLSLCYCVYVYYCSLYCSLTVVWLL